MTNAKKFKIKEELKEYVRNVLAREGVPHRFRKEEEQLYCITPVSGEKFHRVVKRAYCEKLSEESGILHLTYKESQDVNQSCALMKLFKATGYVVVSENRKYNN